MFQELFQALRISMELYQQRPILKEYHSLQVGVGGEQQTGK